MTMTIKWPGGRKTIKDEHDTIKISIEISEILEFEKNIQEVIYEITLWRELLILRDVQIANEYNPENEIKLCTDLLGVIRI